MRWKRPVARSLERRDDLRMPQQTLRREHDERLAPVAFHLAAEAVEVLGRRRGRDDLDIVFGRFEQEAFEAGARMLGAFAFEGVRQEQHDAAEAAPLVFGAGDELIDDHLGGVHEVAVLGFPERRGLRGSRASSHTRSPSCRFRRAGC